MATVKQLLNVKGPIVHTISETATVFDASTKMVNLAADGTEDKADTAPKMGKETLHVVQEDVEVPGQRGEQGAGGQL